MKLDIVLTVQEIEKTPYEKIIALRMVGNNIKVRLEYPYKVIGVNFNVGDKVRLSIDNVKDENYKLNWDVYMWGIVYYVSQNIVRISIGGLILDVEGYTGPVNVGEKVYIGLKRVS